MTVTRHFAQHRRDTSLFKDWVTGEEVTYAYDALNRLQSAVTAGPEWGLDFAYDGFGNKTSQIVTKGTGPGLTLGIDQNTNRVIGATYDANGNQYPPGGAGYDVFNRLQWHQGEWYGYAADNRRVYKSSTNGSNVEITFWGIDGRRLVTFRAETGGATSSTLYFVEPSRNIYFAGKLIRSGADSVILDRLGSVRYRKNGSTTERLDYFPYGEEKPGATTQNREKFATYFRDATGLDYADQRYFNSPHGRFLTPDPAGYGLNWYSYTGGDPVNFGDPVGLAGCRPLSPLADNPNDACPPGWLWDSSVDAPPLFRAAGAGDDGQFDPAEAWAHFLLYAGNQIQVETAIGTESRSECQMPFGSPGAANVGGYIDPSAVLRDVLRNGYASHPLGYTLTAGWAEGDDLATLRRVGGLGGLAPVGPRITGSFKLVIDQEEWGKLGSFGDDIYGIGDQAGSATLYVYQGMTLLHELGHIFALYGYGYLGGSQILSLDSDPAVNMYNQDLIFNECASAIFNKPKVSLQFPR
jgi:RHS repeat-associated protein